MSFPGCCCAPRKPVTIKRTAFKTRTVTVKKTLVANSHAAHQRRSFEAYAKVARSSFHEESPFSESSAQADSTSGLNARHLCPACPTGVKLVAAGKGLDVTYCCPARKTVSKVFTKTRIATRTLTVTAIITVGAFFKQIIKEGAIYL